MAATTVLLGISYHASHCYGLQESPFDRAAVYFPNLEAYMVPSDTMKAEFQEGGF